MSTKYFLQKLINKEHLKTSEALDLMRLFLSGSTNQIQLASLLTLLSVNGVNSQELCGFIEGMREKMEILHTNIPAIDVCGTGGDGKGTFNISTAVSFVVAGCGVPVAKHGNRASSGKCGSADVLEALGIPIDLSVSDMRLSLSKIGIAFLFAPLYHPSMRYVSPVRKELGTRTIFNFLGPFVNPASVKRQVVGISDLLMIEPLAEASLASDYDHLMLVVSEDGMDEASVTAKSRIVQIQGKHISRKMIDPRTYGFLHTSSRGLEGGDAHANALIIHNILEGEPGIRRDAVVFNSALALLVSGNVNTIEEGVTLASESLDAGKAMARLDQFRVFCKERSIYETA